MRARIDPVPAPQEKALAALSRGERDVLPLNALYGFATNLVGKHRRGELRALRAMERVAAAADSEGPQERIAGRVSAEGLRELPADEEVVLRPGSIYPGLPAGVIASMTTVRSAGWTGRPPA